MGLGFYIQSIVGFAASLVALPIILNVLNIQESVALMSIFFFIFSVISIYKDRKSINKQIVIKLSIGVILGLILGVLILKVGNPIILKKALGIFILFFVAYSYIKKQKIKLFKRADIVFGFVGGLFSGLFATGGPPFVIYIYNTLQQANTIRATIIGILGITNFLRVPMLIGGNILTKDIFITSLYILPFFLLALFLGQKTYKKINDKSFTNALMVLLILSGISLIIR